MAGNEEEADIHKLRFGLKGAGTSDDLIRQPFSLPPVVAKAQADLFSFDTRNNSKIYQHIFSCVHIFFNFFVLLGWINFS